MNNVKPNDLTELQWLLLRHLHQCSTPFYTDSLYTQFSRYEIDRLEFYQLFFVLATHQYIQLHSYGKIRPGYKQDFCYVVTSKGKKAIAEATQKDNSTSPFSIKIKQEKRKVLMQSPTKTITLKDYVLSI